MMLFKRKARKQRDVGITTDNSPQSGNIPAHIGIIMDGNGRWATERGLPRELGHRAGAEALRKITEYCSGIGVKAITAYAFSTENWNRPPAEVAALMKLLLEYLKDSEKRLAGKNNRIRVIGDRSKLSDEIVREIEHTEALTGNNGGLVLNLAINYGGRDEIARAAQLIASDVQSGRLSPQGITAEKLSERLYTSDLPEVDLIIRTGGDRRLSNFLLWQAAYAELWYTDTYFPDFCEADIAQAIVEFGGRERRFGRV